MGMTLIEALIKSIEEELMPRFGIKITTEIIQGINNRFLKKDTSGKQN